MQERLYEGIVEKGCVRLPDDVVLPEFTKVYILVQDSADMPHLPSPHMVRPVRTREREAS